MVRRRHRRPRFFLALDLFHVPPHSVIIVGIAIVPIEQYGDQIGHQIVPAISDTGEIIKAWLGPMGFLEYHWYPGEEASLRVAELGQARKEGVVVVDIVPPQPTSALVQCHAPIDGGVATDLVHGQVGLS